MKKHFLTFICLLVCQLVLAQAKKPTLMVIPSDVWCNQNGYMMEFDNQGTTVKLPDYKKAFQENADLLFVISKVNQLMADRGFPLKNLESALKTIESNQAEQAMLSSKETGATVSENPIDLLKSVAKSDIILQLTWTINKTGPKKSVTFNLQGLDAYTDKQVAAASGTGNPSFSAELPVLLEEAVLSHLDNFNGTLMAHFDDLFANGREVILRVKKWDDWDEDLESEVGEDGDDLSTVIEDWIADNTVNGRYNLSDATENMMLLEQVRIPLYYERKGKQRAMDTRRYAKKLSSFLKKNYEIESKVMMKGLGRATIYLGGK